MNRRPSLCVVIPTYMREEVLVDTISLIIEQAVQVEAVRSVVVVDQTASHESSTVQKLAAWNRAGLLKWMQLAEPNLTRAMNTGLQEANADIVLFTDDDVVPGPGWIEAHLRAYEEHREASAVVGQILQPGELAEDIRYQPTGGKLFRYLDFPFRSTKGCFVENVMAGNLSVVRRCAVEVGGFDENFTPPVASRFETEFAKRFIDRGFRVWFEPAASIRHLRAETGGTRSLGGHLNSMSPRYGVGDCYYALRHGRGFERLVYLARRPFREIRTRYHLRHPWWIPVKFAGELRAIGQALRIARCPPRLLTRPPAK